jgi:hypothetical protein
MGFKATRQSKQCLICPDIHVKRISTIFITTRNSLIFVICFLLLVGVAVALPWKKAPVADARVFDIEIYEIDGRT